MSLFSVRVRTYIEMIRVKVLTKGSKTCDRTLDRGGCRFIFDASCRDYDWLLVYDEMPRNAGSVVKEAEPLACPKEHTVLVTCEPPSIKIYPSSYTHQFGHVLTTHTPKQLPHPSHHYGEGCLFWCAGISPEEAFSMPDYPKSKDLATVCSAKQMNHTLHSKRYELTKYISERIPEMDWYGWGVKKLDKKFEAQNDYRYSIAIENYVAPYHWTDKIADPLLSLCLTFYVGDPRLEEIFPAESFIRIPLDDHEKAYQIIREAIDNKEYEKRLPFIREARRRLVEQYNTYDRVAALIKQHSQSQPAAKPQKQVLLKGRHRLRRNVFNILTEAWESLRYKMGITK